LVFLKKVLNFHYRFLAKLSRMAKQVFEPIGHTVSIKQQLFQKKILTEFQKKLHEF